MPVASQTNLPPYAEGVVGTNNRIDLDNVIVGHYRLVVDAVGYEPVDTTFLVTDDDPTEVINVAVMAQPAPTQTPVPTAVPTIEPTAIPTIAPTTEPTAMPTIVPTVALTVVPTIVPTIEPTIAPTVEPLATPTIVPTSEPTPVPTTAPVNIPVTGLPDTGSGRNPFIPLTLVSLLAALIVSTLALNHVRREL